ncbi:hypothetical protein GCM10023196_102330 [Actinoallomurus vinaceus]|uniref:Uncharacterized protein n=1 Tax=Actinoallomurus vinaceus TaxID=1080074 RepID=A0ABP8UWE7_9ACTN
MEGRFPCVAAIPAAICTIVRRVYFFPCGSIMITLEPVTVGSGFDGRALGDVTNGEGVTALALALPLAVGDADGVGEPAAV